MELLLKGNGVGLFNNVSGQVVPNTSGDDNDSKFFDLDNDGDLDLIIASLFQTREKVYINDGNGNFAIDNTIISNNKATRRRSRSSTRPARWRCRSPRTRTC